MGNPRHYNVASRDHGRSDPRDRRRVCRYAVNLPDTALGWWEGQSFTQTPCRITDLSTNGCQVQTRSNAHLAEQQSVWILPPGVEAAGWTEGVVVAIGKPLFRPRQVRIRFLADLPYELFKTLVFATGKPHEPVGAVGPEYEKDHFWR
jgi:hypothetical protein